jgi:hypothetical protein
MILRPLFPAIALALAVTIFQSQAPAASTEKSEPTASPDIHMRVDSLPPADVKEAIELLKKNYLNPNALTDSELDRATLQGLLSRIAPGGQLIAPAASGDGKPNAFYAEIIDNRIGYMRLGSLLKSNIDEMDSALGDFESKSLKSAILDLRATPVSKDFEMAAELVKRFSPKGKILFTIKKPSTKENKEFTSDQDAKFHELLIVLADNETAGAAEVALAALRAHAKAMIVGQLTAGQAAEFVDMPLPSGKVLRIAVAEIALPNAGPIFPGGVKPDIAVEMSDVQKQLRLDLEKSVSQFVFDSERPRMNEAALVSGKNPELDALQAAQHNKSPAKPSVHDAVLQRAVDLITSIGIYENRAQK